MKARRLVIPRLLHVPGRGTWTVRVARLRDQENRGVSYGPPARRILVDCEQRGAKRDETFVHEVLRAVWPQRVVSSAIEEALVAAISPRLHHLLATEQIALAPRYDESAARLDSYRRYNESPKGKARAARRERTVRGKDRIRRYAQSPKGRARQARYQTTLARRLSVRRYKGTIKHAAAQRRYRAGRLA